MRPRFPHLSAGVSALGFAACCLLALVGGMRAAEARYLARILPLNTAVKEQGVALQRAAFRRPDVLTLYGTSELIRHIRGRPSVFFQHAPTGFVVDPIGEPGAISLITAERLAAMGPEVRGRKIAVLISPTLFYAPAGREGGYDHNFSPLVAQECLANPALSLGLRRDFASAMQAFPETVRGHLALEDEIRQLSAAGSGWGAGEFVRIPIDWAVRALWRVEDHVRVARYLWDNRTQLGRPYRRRRHIEWASDLAAYERRSPDFFRPEQRKTIKPAQVEWMVGGGMQNALEHNPEWNDLALLLRTLNELGAEPLIICIPMNAIYFDEIRLPQAPREYFYGRLHGVCEKMHTPLLDFREHEYDPKFFQDAHDHFSPKGWLLINETLDRFYQGELPPAQSGQTQSP